MSGAWVMSDAWLSAGVLLLALALFASERVRHDLVAIAALLACVVLGLVNPADAFSGFGDPAVVTVAAVLIIGRAIELTGAVTALTERIMPGRAPFSVQLAILMLVGAALSAFMNNIAALAITMPAAIAICRRHRLSAGAALMPLAFATILGGMTTLIGTPANLILSSFRHDALGAPLGFFAMAPAGVAVTLVGLLYLALIGWRLTPRRRQSGRADAAPETSLFVFEQRLDGGGLTDGTTLAQMQDRLQPAHAQCVAVIRDGKALVALPDVILRATDRLLLTAREDPWAIAKLTGLPPALRAKAPDAATARVVVAHGSPLVGHPHDMVEVLSDGEVRVVAAGPRAAERRQPLRMLEIQPGDQLVLHGPAMAIGRLVRYARLLEVGRHDVAPAASGRAVAAGLIYLAAVVVAVGCGVSTAITFAAAAALFAALKFLPARDIYRSIDWPAVVLLGAMIPVGQSFESSGAAAAVAQVLSHVLAAAPLVVALGAMTVATLLLSIFLNNVATAVIMGPVALQVAASLGASPDAFLIAVLIGASSDFLTPIGHQNNLLVMGPGGYRFTDYARVGGVLSLLVVVVAAVVLARTPG